MAEANLELRCQRVVVDEQGITTREDSRTQAVYEGRIRPKRQILQRGGKPIPQSNRVILGIAASVEIGTRRAAGETLP